MKNTVQYSYRAERWMVLTPEWGFLGSALTERDAKLFAMAHEMFDLLKGLCRDKDTDGSLLYHVLDKAENIIQQIEPILSINNQEGE